MGEKSILVSVPSVRAFGPSENCVSEPLFAALTDAPGGMVFHWVAPGRFEKLHMKFIDIINVRGAPDGQR